MKKCFTPKDKFWKVMKLCSIQAVAAMTLCSMALAHDHYGQVLDKKITISLRDVSIEEALEAIEELTYVKFFYSVDQLGIREKVSIEAVDRSLGDILDEVLTPYRIQYKVHEKKSTITLKKHEEEPPSGLKKQEKERAGSGLSLSVATVTGTVTDAATGFPMAGVNIIEKGTMNGTVSDADGQYIITVGDQSSLVVSFIGYKILEIEVNGRSVINVSLEEDIATLQEVTINAGYWSVKKAQNTGNISKVGADEIANQPVFNPMATIQGRMPGVFVTEQSGVPGSGYNIQIRGRNSLRVDANEPLYVVDGVPFTANHILQGNPTALRSPSPLSLINPADIESIEILKDADATAIYGSRGANGVVLITTKKGESHNTSIEANVSIGRGEVPNRVEMLSTEQYLEMRKEAFLNDGRNPGASDHDVNGTWDQNRYTDWQNVLFGGTANLANAQLSVSGGSQNTKFLFSGNYNRQTTVFPGDMFYKKGSGHFNLSHESDNQKFRFTLSTNFALENNSLGYVDFFDRVYNLPPNAPSIYNEEGDLNWEDNTWLNPLADVRRKYGANTQNLIANAGLNYEVLRHVLLKASFGYTSILSKEETTTPMNSQQPGSSLHGYANFIRGSQSTWIMEPQIEYRNEFGNGIFTALLGATVQESMTDGLSVFASGFQNDELLGSIEAAPQDNTLASNAYVQYRYNALFGRINYNLDQKYVLNLTGRRDGSSRFGEGKQFANFGAIGVAWLFFKEGFAKSALPFLSYGKIRGSYGITGNDQIGDYGYLASYESIGGSLQYEGGTTLRPARLANPDYAWENNKKIEGGIELGVLKDRITLSASYYRNRSSNQLVGLPLPGTTGFSTIQYNLNATVENTGWEFELNTENLKLTNFSWTTGLNFSAPRNKLIEYPDLESSSHSSVYRVGEPLNVSIRYEYTGVDTETGVYRFVDMDGSGSISSADDAKPVIIGPDYYGGVQNRLIYKGFQFDILIQFVKNTSSTYRRYFGTPGRMGNQPVEVLNRWREGGDLASVQKFTSRTGPPNTAHSRWLNSDGATDDASFIRLKNLAISYHISAELLRKLNLKSSRIYLQGRNIITLTKYKGLDPESHLGIIRSFMAGIQVGI